ncbi:hypothetical protein D3C81_1991880 [compost metagenome]
MCSTRKIAALVAVRVVCGVAVKSHVKNVPATVCSAAAEAAVADVLSATAPCSVATKNALHLPNASRMATVTALLLPPVNQNRKSAVRLSR